MRCCIMASQFFFKLFYGTLYLISPTTAHRFVAYLEEEAVKTYTLLIKELDEGKLPNWQNIPAPPDAIKYWGLDKNAKFRDVIVSIRADEVAHREFNHHFADIPKNSPIARHKMEILKSGIVHEKFYNDSEKPNESFGKYLKENDVKEDDKLEEVEKENKINKKEEKLNSKKNDFTNSEESKIERNKIKEDDSKTKNDKFKLKYADNKLYHDHYKNINKHPNKEKTKKKQEREDDEIENLPVDDNINEERKKKYEADKKLNEKQEKNFNQNEDNKRGKGDETFNRNPSD